MPSANHKMITTLEVEGRPLVLKRRIAEYSSRRIAESIPALRRLNEARFTLDDAACKLAISRDTVRAWADLAGIEWNSARKKPRG